MEDKMRDYGKGPENNPYHAYKHLMDASWLGPTDRAAAECLFKWAKEQNDHAKSIRRELKFYKRMMKEKS